MMFTIILCPMTIAQLSCHAGNALDVLVMIFIIILQCYVKIGVNDFSDNDDDEDVD